MTKSRGINRPRSPWTLDQDRVLLERYGRSVTADLAKLVGHSLSSTYQRAKKLGLKKDPDFVAEVARDRISSPDHPGRATQFKKGATVWNKGLKGVCGVHEACRATQFKKGRPAHEARNYVPIGTTRVTRDGILERKVTDDPSIVPVRRWVAVARLVWTEAHGEIPAGHVVVFRQGQHSNVEAEITIDRLELLSRRELMLRNTFHRYGPDVVKVVQLRGAITRQINKRKEEADVQQHQ